jgi:hypothetical protein
MQKHSRAVTHMREQKKLKRFGLVFGTGISRDFGFPLWEDLVKQIAEDSRVDGNQILDMPSAQTIKSQLLFQNYRAKVLEGLPQDFDQYDRLHSRIQSGWHAIVHDALYKNIPDNIDEFKGRDKYLYEFLDIIKDTRLTVNYNFDDTLQTLLNDKATNKEIEGRGFRTIWSSDIQLYPQDGVIYHPNGFLPHRPGERPSDDLIFLEGSFGDQLLESISGHYMALSYHFSQNTCLFIGLSLDDPTLKHLLRRNAILHPGHIHYFINFIEDGVSLDEEKRNAIRDANFEVYNLVTLFLDRKGIATLGQLLKYDDEKFELIADELGVSAIYKFFLTGSVCVGKSTTVSHFRSLCTHDEWLDQRAPCMEIDPSKIEKISVIEHIDKWVADQWRAKNFKLSNEKHGIHIIDRSPLDAIAFTPKDKWIDKAKYTRETITPNLSKTSLCKGKVILMIGDANVMSARAMKLQKDMPPEKLQERQDMLRTIYNSEYGGIYIVDTCNKSIQRVVKEVCRVIHINDYFECDFQHQLQQIELGKINPPDSH